MSPTIRFKNREFRHHFAVESYGVRIGVSANTADAIAAAKQCINNTLPLFSVLGRDERVEHRFFYVRNDSRDSLYLNGDTLLAARGRDFVLDTLASKVKLTVAEHSPGRVFVHAGSVSWKGKAIVLPGHSYRGKSTLTAELVRQGAKYMSDEYAIVDERGYIYAYPKKISVRASGGYRQTDRSIASFGGTVETGPVAASLIVVTEFKDNAKWDPKPVTQAAAILKILKHTVPIRRDPQFALSVLARLVKGAGVFTTRRGEAKEAAKKIIQLAETLG